MYEADLDLNVLRHTASHIMAQAIKRLFPNAKLAIGPFIENGFYYDIDVEPKIVEADIEKIEAEMKKIIKENLKVEAFKLPREEAIKFMEERNEPYKVELIKDLPEDEELSFFKQGEFVDLCTGPHMLYTKAVKVFKIMSITGAYWRGDEKNKMLQRLYATAFDTKEGLDKYLQDLEAKHPEFFDANSPTQRVGGAITKNFPTIVHEHRMYSLENSYSKEDLLDWEQRIQKVLGNVPVQYVCELKYDGASISISYENGKLVRAVTRGDGFQGDEVTNNIKTIKSVPLQLKGNYPEKFDIRGEIVLPFAGFEKMNQELIEIGETPISISS